MSIYLTMCVGILSHLLLAVGAVVVCSEKETLLQTKPSTVTQLTDCLMECTGLTYIRKQQLQDERNIRMQDSAEGDLGEYCWPTDIKCLAGESFESAYVVLPVDTSVTRHEQLEIRSASTALRSHISPTTVPDGCGLRYDVSAFFSAVNRDTSFCVQVVSQQDALGDNVLKCPPYLVSFWQRDQSNHGGQL